MSTLNSPAVLLVRPDEIDNPEEFLSSAEKEYIQQVRNPLVRQNWMVSRVLVKRLTENSFAQSQAGNLAFSDYTVISKNAIGKGCQPFVTDVNGVRLPYWYTISHVNEFVAAGIDCQNSLGLDLCKIGSVAAVVERSFFTEKERTALDNAAPEFRSVLSSMIWAAKEAAYKYMSIQTLEPFFPIRYEFACAVTEIEPAQTAPFDPFGLTLDFSGTQFSKEKVVYTGKENALSASVQFCRYENVVVALAR